MRSRQRGISYWGVVLGITLFGMMIKIGAAVGPIYMDYMAIDKMIAGMFKEPSVDGLNIADFRSGIESRMQINNIRDRKIDDLMVIRREGNIFVVVLDYEERKPLMGNLDVVAHFRKSYSTENPDGVVEEKAEEPAK
jgi:hypothetical protein